VRAEALQECIVSLGAIQEIRSLGADFRQRFPECDTINRKADTKTRTHGRADFGFSHCMSGYSMPVCAIPGIAGDANWRNYAARCALALGSLEIDPVQVRSRHRR
jgi:hypothetical protein